MRLREPVVYAILLLGALGFAYQTWTRDASGSTDTGGVPLWEESPEDLVAVRYETPDTLAVIERRGSEDDRYLWATVVQANATPQLPRADSGAASPATDTLTQAVDTVRFVVGARGQRLIEDLAMPRALRDLGPVDAAGKAEYGLADATARLTVTFSGEEREVLVGAQVYGSGDRYALDPATGRAYVLPEDVVDPLENAAARLLERRLHDFGRDEIARVVVQVGEQQRTMLRSEGADFGDETWAAPDSPDRPDQTFANFMDRLQRLWVDGYEPDADVSGLERVVRVDYFTAADESLGYFELFRRAGQQVESEYLLRTELTRGPARTYGRLAEQVAGDVGQLF